MLKIINIKSKLPTYKIKEIRDKLRGFALSIAQKTFNLKLGVSEASKVLINLGPEEKILVKKKPYSLEDIPHEFNSRIGKFVVHSLYYYEVLNAELIGPFAAGFDNEDNLIQETTIPTFYKTTDAISLRTLISKYRPFTSKTSILEGTYVSLVNIWSHNYFHWILDCLARLESLEHYQKATGLKPLLLIPKSPTKWQLESLWLLGYDEKNFILWNYSRIQIEKLILPSFCRSSAAGISPRTCRWLRQHMLNGIDHLNNQVHEKEFSSRVLISRRKASRRRVINESEVIDALAPLGFVAYALEELTFSEQVKLFSQAEFVIGPHGAGMTNMIFSPKLKIIELFNRNSQYFQPVFFSLSQALGHEYGLLKGSPSPESHLTRNDDLVVEIGQLLDLAELML